MHKAGLVAVIGKPNVGKSTLVNAVVGHKVSIVSDKVQTTRRRVLGIATHQEYQIVFVDTPGVHKPKHKLGSALNESARGSLYDVDVALVVVDVSKMPSAEDERVAQMLKSAGIIGPGSKHTTPVIICMNKMDKLDADRVELHWNTYKKLFETETTVMTSFTKGQNMDILVGLVVSALPENPPFFGEDEYTDQSSRFLVSEIVREKVLHKLKHEVPHAIATFVDAWEDEGKLIHIAVDILVEREGQKAIVIGKKGAMLKAIGTEARTEIEEMLDRKVFLELFVKVREDWRQSPRWLKELEYLD